MAVKAGRHRIQLGRGGDPAVLEDPVDRWGLEDQVDRRPVARDNQWDRVGPVDREDPVDRWAPVGLEDPAVRWAPVDRWGLVGLAGQWVLEGPVDQWGLEARARVPAF